MTVERERELGSAEGAQVEFVHPDALGVRKTERSRFTQKTASGTLSVVRVLRWNGQRGWTSSIADLTRGRGRPMVYCPFCGRRGAYAHTDRYQYFKHGDGEQDCVESHLESIRHKRAKLLLVAGIRNARAQGRALQWARRCETCGEDEIADLLPANAWDSEGDEIRLQAGASFVVFDVAATMNAGPVVGLEVRAAHAVDADKLGVVEASGVPLVEMLAESLVDERGERMWDGSGPLPPAFVWRVDGLACPHRCSGCASQTGGAGSSTDEDSVWEVLRQVCRSVRKSGLAVETECHRCHARHPTTFLRPDSKVAEVRDDPPTVQFTGPNGPVSFQVGGDVDPGMAGPSVVVPRADLDGIAGRSGQATVRADQIQGWNPKPGPKVCNRCRRASETAEDVDRLWALACRLGPKTLSMLRGALEERLELHGGALAEVREPFALDMDLRPEKFRASPSLSALAWAGLRGRTTGLKLLEALLSMELEGTWSSLAELLPAPHQLLLAAMEKGETVQRESLVLADRVLFSLQLDDEAREARGQAWVVEAVLDHCGGGHTAWAGGVEGLTKRVYSRIRRAYGKERIQELGTGTWVRRSVESGVLRRVRWGDGELLATARHVRESADFAGFLLEAGSTRFSVDGGLASDLVLDPVQSEAVAKAVGCGLAVITGGAGTGKTTVVRAVLQTLSRSPAVVAAPTGKAAERLRVALDGVDHVRGAYTVAKLLTKPALLEHAEVLVVDEAGFLDLSTAFKLTGLVRKLGQRGPSRVVFVGDPNQLSSIGPGAVLRDALDARHAGRPVLPQEMLTTGFRSEAQLQVFAKSVLAGAPDLGQVEHLDVADEDVAEAVLECTGQLHSLDGVQVIAPTRDLVSRLNRGMQRRWNSTGRPLGSTHLRNGDRVMCTQNRYEDPFILNGEQGKLRAIADADGLRFSLLIDGEERGPFDFREYTNFDLAYAVTIHKAQGSEWDTVVVAVPSTKFFDQKMLYTAVTRAKRRLVLVGPRGAVIGAARRVRERQTLLRTFLESQAGGYSHRLVSEPVPGSSRPSGQSRAGCARSAAS